MVAAGLLFAGLLLPDGAAAARDPVRATLSALAARGGEQADRAVAWNRLYLRAGAAARRLRGAPAANLRGALDNLRSLARRKMLATRAAPAFLILRRNVEWFWEDRRSAPAYGTRTTFPGSPIIYEFYPGSGWQLQPLANFGRLAAIAPLRSVKVARLERWADELLDTAVRRAGFLAFEYYFPFSRGAPGWVSGMATAVGMTAFARIWKRDHERRYLDAARSMRRVFARRPPVGVRIRLREGPFYLLYSQAPWALVANGFAESILDLDEYSRTARDAVAARLAREALSTARRILPLYDTGAWSLYERTPHGPGPESTLEYHELLQSQAARLCDRFGAPFCRLADRFARYEREPVRIARISVRILSRRLLKLTFTASKRGYVTARVLHGRRTVRAYGTWLTRGTHVFIWRRPAAGRYTLTFTTASLNGVRDHMQRDFRLRK